jgi:ATP-binding cassette subfamily B (MDR/TAP) protein 1
MALATSTEKLIYGIVILAAMVSGTVLPLMTLIFGNFVSVFTDFALDQLTADEFRGKVNHYT